MLNEQPSLPDFFLRPATFHQSEPLPFSALVNVLSARFGTRIIITPDALEYLGQINETLRNHENSLTGATYSVHHNGNIESLLDEVGAKANLSWRWHNGQVEFFRHMTKTLVIDNLTPSNLLAGNGLSSRNTGNTHSSNMWDDLARSIGSMMSRGGKFTISEGMGTVTVTDTPEAIGQMDDFIASLNSMLGRQISVRTEVYTLPVNHDGTLDLQWDQIDQSLLTSTSVPYNAFESLRSGRGLGMSVLPGGANWRGSRGEAQQHFLSTLANQTDLSLVTTSSVHTTNGQAVPIRVMDEFTPISGGLVSGQEPVLQSGLDMSVLPRIGSSGDILLEVNMDLSRLNDIQVFGRNGSGIEMANQTRREFNQQTSLRSGETLLITGLESPGTEPRSGRAGIFSSPQQKMMTIIMVTPYLMQR